MCGICGLIAPLSNTQKKQLITRMVKHLTHRGPDEQSQYLSSQIALGSTRLAIIDLTTGTQPIWNEAKTMAIVFNGEVYNYLYLRKKLQAQGHRFKTKTDTEVVLHLFEEKRERCLSDLEGMFGLAIWDKKTQSLFLARDRFGQKPLFYSHKDSLFAFASEIKALLSLPFVRKQINPALLAFYFFLLYIPQDQPFFADIKSLSPGHYLWFQNGTVKTKAYWKPKVAEKPITPKQAVNQLKPLLEEAVKKRLQSDVPLGTYLSGGIDSSLVTALASRHLSQPVKTFSVGFGKKTDERWSAQLLAKTYQTDHTEILLSPQSLQQLPQIFQTIDWPFADPSILPSYLLAQQVKQQVTVVLTGDGGDEAFGGFPISASMVTFLTKLAWLPFWRQRTVLDYLHFWYQRPESINRLLDLPQHTSENLFQDYFSPLYNSNLKAVEQAFAFDTLSYLPFDLLYKLDMTSMAHGLEARSPFLDHGLLQFALCLPGQLKFHQNREKFLLKEAFSELLPNQLLTKKKQGFDFPLKQWLTHKKNRAFISQIFAINSPLRQLVADRPLNQVRYRFNAGQLRSSQDWHFLWQLICLYHWYQQYNLDARSY